MKKQLAAGLLALALSVPFSTAALADLNQGSNPPSQEVTVQSSIQPAYLVSIPSNTTITAGQLSTNFGSVALKSAQLDPGYAVSVSLRSDYKLENAADSTKTIAYAVRSNGKDFRSASYTAAGQSTPLTIEITADAWRSAFAGDYSDTMTFTISYGQAGR